MKIDKAKVDDVYQFKDTLGAQKASKIEQEKQKITEIIEKFERDLNGNIRTYFKENKLRFRQIYEDVVSKLVSLFNKQKNSN